MAELEKARDLFEKDQNGEGYVRERPWGRP
jgi:hypothetical protein